MNIEDAIGLLGVLGIGGVLGAFADNYIRVFLERKKALEIEVRKKKEEQYKVFLENLIGFYNGWDSSGKKNFMEELYTHAPLYASAVVFKLAIKFIKSQEINDTNKVDLSRKGKTDAIYRELVIAIRDDLGSWKKDKHQLSKKDIEVFSPPNT